MASRKETPDVLGEMLGAGATASQPAPAPKPKTAPKRRAPSRKASSKRRVKRAQWEYVEIVFRDYGGFRPCTINGEEVRHWKRAPLIYRYLNHLGEQGWELAGVGSQHKGQMPVYLKRLKA